MRRAILYTPLGGDRVQCNVCLWRCRIASGRLGRCKVRLNSDGALHTLSYARVAAVHVDPIEKKPLYHFYPGSKVFSLGSFGCNFRCIHCQNWSISYAEPRSFESPSDIDWEAAGYAAGSGTLVSPEQAVDAAIRSRCEGICWTYNEPAVWFEYTLDTAKLAKAKGMYTAYVTNGYVTPEALDAIGKYLDAFRVDFKGFNPDLYWRLAKVARWDGLLEVARLAKQRWSMHVEVVTNVIPTFNDDDGQLSGIARWIHANLGPETPWHVTAFHPDAMLRDVPATPVATLLRARQLGVAAGLRFVYIGNVSGTGAEDTRCNECGLVAIERHGYLVRKSAVAAGGRCERCGADLNIRGA